MISKNDILKFVKQVHRRNRGIPDRRLIHPRREWLIGLGLFMVVAVIGALFSLRTFEFYKTIDTKSYTIDISVPSYNQKLAQNVLEDFTARKETYSELTTAATRFVPPTPVVEDTVSTTTEATTTPETVTTDEATSTPPSNGLLEAG